MKADNFIDSLRNLSQKVLAAKPGEYPQSTIQNARTWRDIRVIEPRPTQVVQDDIADLLACYFVSPVVIGEFKFEPPLPGMRRLRFATFKPKNRPMASLYVDTFENMVYQSTSASQTQSLISQTSGDFLDCLSSYAYYLSHRTTRSIADAVQLRSLESEFLSRISSIPGSEWWRQNIALHH